MSMTRNQRRRRAWALLIIWAVTVFLMVAFASAFTWALKQVDAPQEPSAEQLLYIEGQYPTPQTQAELARAMEEEDTRESENIETALLERAVKIEGVTVSHYCICEKCCGKSPDDPGYGITASGRAAAPGVSVAVDPSVIPLGSDVLVDYGDGEIHYYRADDTGGAVKGAHIDLCMESHEAAMAAGLKTGVTLWWVAQKE